MADAAIPDADTLVRHVKRRETIRDPDTDELKGILKEAFMLRPVDGGNLSALWLEYYAPASPTEQLEKSVWDFRKALTVQKKAAFTKGNVGAIKTAFKAANRTIRVLHEPDEPHLPSHVAVRRFDDSLEEVLQYLADTG